MSWSYWLNANMNSWVHREAHHKLSIIKHVSGKDHNYLISFILTVLHFCCYVMLTWWNTTGCNNRGVLFIHLPWLTYETASEWINSALPFTAGIVPSPVSHWEKAKPINTGRMYQNQRCRTLVSNMQTVWSFLYRFVCNLSPLPWVCLRTPHN